MVVVGGGVLDVGGVEELLPLPLGVLGVVTGVVGVRPLTLLAGDGVTTGCGGLLATATGVVTVCFAGGVVTVAGAGLAVGAGGFGLTATGWEVERLAGALVVVSVTVAW